MRKVRTEIKIAAWPSPQDYNDAIQNLVANTNDLELRKAKVQTNALGLPRSVSGSFASVYRVKADKSDLAVRCFLRDISDQETRYKLISDFVQHDSLPYTVAFDFMPHGIRVGGQWYPALKMDWVEGNNLDLWIEEHSGEPELLGKLPGMFKKMCVDLREAGIAHGDLQHGNIIVCGDELRLVDYDGMYVPAMQGMQANELGHRNYQHPLRTPEDFGAELDNFSAWVIYASLRAVAIDKSLWEMLGAGDDCLLFRRDDFVEPEHSYAFAVLEHHPNHEIRALAKFLRWQCHNAVRDVPPLSDVIPAPPSIIGELTAVIKQKRLAPQTFAETANHAASVKSTPPAAVVKSSLPEWIGKNPSVASIVGSRPRPKAPPSRVAQDAVVPVGPEPELDQPVPRDILSKPGAMWSPSEQSLLRNGDAVRTQSFAAYDNNVLGKHNYVLSYTFNAPITNQPVNVNRFINADEYARLKDLKEATVMCDHIAPSARNALYELLGYRAVKPIIPTGIEPELKRRPRAVKFREQRFINPMVMTAILVGPAYLLAMAVFTASAASAVGNLLLTALFYFLMWLIWHKANRHNRLVSSGIPARATVYGIEAMPNGEIKIDYGFMSVQGMIKSSVRALASDFHGFQKGDVVSVLYDLQDPHDNVIYQLALYSAVP